MSVSSPELELLPREKLSVCGPRALSDEELLAVMLGTGVKGASVQQVASHVLSVLAEETDEPPRLDRLQAVNGVGPSKALLLAAAFEFSRRRIRPEGTKIRRASDVLPLLSHIVDRPQEHVLTISLSGAHEVIKVRTVSIGLLTSCPIHPREVFVGPIQDRAYSVILAHNHPSGDPTPSQEDRTVTTQLCAAGKTLGLKVLDHIIFARRGYYSFQEQGQMG